MITTKENIKISESELEDYFLRLKEVFGCKIRILYHTFYEIEVDSFRPICDYHVEIHTPEEISIKEDIITSEMNIIKHRIETIYQIQVAFGFFKTVYPISGYNKLYFTFIFCTI